MKLKTFTARDVHGYLNFNLAFHSDISCLIGVNGSGKTTILRLIQALLTPSFRDMLSIPFSVVSVTFEDKGIPIKVDAKKMDEKIELSVSGVESVLAIPRLGVDELDYMVTQRARGEEVFEDLQLKFSEHEVFQYISKINVPVFLGLERTHKGSAENASEFYFERERMLSNNVQRGMKAKRIIKGTLAAGLMETQILVQDAYRQIRRIENKYSEKLREDILLSSFKYTELSLFTEEMPNMMEQKEILQRKDELAYTLKNIGISSERTTKLLDEFFLRLESLFRSMDKAQDTKAFPLEWVVNKAQIDTVSGIIKVIDDHNSRLAKAFAPINTFIETVNCFYKDTNKELTIDTVGQLLIKRPDGKLASIDALSSGERQLLIIYAHLLFNQYSSRSNVFIIDEPELSLHLKWQEIFVLKALEVSPSTQLILATHSPEIIGDFESNTILV